MARFIVIPVDIRRHKEVADLSRTIVSLNGVAQEHHSVAKHLPFVRLVSIFEFDHVFRRHYFLSRVNCFEEFVAEGLSARFRGIMVL